MAVERAVADAHDRPPRRGEVAVVSSVLLCIDLDGTVVDASSVQATYADWHAAVLAGTLPPIREAQRALCPFRRVEGEAVPAHRTILATSRLDELRGATVAWLRRHFPALARLPLTMRAPDDKRPGWELKADAIRAARGASRVVLVDDDADAIKAVGAGDAYIHPRDWPILRCYLPSQ